MAFAQDEGLWRAAVTSTRAVVVAACVLAATPAAAVPVKSDFRGQLFGDMLAPGVPVASSSAATITLGRRVGASALARVNEDLRAGRYQAVIQDARAVIARQPDSGLAYEVLGTAEFMMGHTGEAIASFRKSTEVEAGHSGGWTKLGIALMEAGDVAQAEPALRRAIALNPADRFAHQRLGLLLEYTGNVAKAIEHLELGLRGTPPDYVGVAVNLARLLTESHQSQRAVAVLAPRLPQSADDPLAQLVLGNAYLAAQEHSQAERRFRRAVELSPSLREATLGIAMAQRGAGKQKEALATIESLLAEDASWLPAHAERAENLLRMNKLAEADAAFDRYVALGGNAVAVDERKARYYVEHSSPEQAAAIYERLVVGDNADAEMYGRLAELRMATGEPGRAEEILRAGLARFPDNANLHLRLGSHFAALGQYREALPDLRRAQALSPDDKGVLRALALTHVRLGEVAAAADAAGRLYAVSPQSDVGVLYATALESSGKAADAEAVYRSVLKADPDHPVALNNLANMLLAGSQMAEAERLAVRATELEPDNGRMLDTLGWIYFQQGKHDRAIRALDRAVELAPDVGAIQYHRGQVLLALDRRADGRAAIAEALRLQPEASWAPQARKTLGLAN